VAESLARRHAERLELTGLGPRDIATVVASVASVVPDGEQSSDWPTAPTATRSSSSSTPASPARAATSSRCSTAPTRPLPSPTSSRADWPRSRRHPRPAAVGAVLGRRFPLADLAAVADLPRTTCWTASTRPSMPGWCVRWGRTASPSPTPWSGTR
jgi:hypothetical protein